MKKNAIFEDFFSWATKKNAKTRKEFGIEWKKDIFLLGWLIKIMNLVALLFCLNAVVVQFKANNFQLLNRCVRASWSARKKKSFWAKKIAPFFSRPPFSNEKPGFVFELSGKQITGRKKLRPNFHWKPKRSRISQAIFFGISHKITKVSRFACIENLKLSLKKGAQKKNAKSESWPPTPLSKTQLWVEYGWMEKDPEQWLLSLIWHLFGPCRFSYSETSRSSSAFVKRSSSDALLCSCQ